MDWFLYDNGLRHERVNQLISVQCSISEPTENVSSGFQKEQKLKIGVK